MLPVSPSGAGVARHHPNQHTTSAATLSPEQRALRRRDNVLSLAALRHGDALQSTARAVDSSPPQALARLRAIADSSDGVTRRGVLALAAVTTLAGLSSSRAQADELVLEAPAEAAAPPPFASKPFASAKQQYSLLIPEAWDVKDKAGADVLFEDPARRSTSIGITVNPVRRVKTLGEFGSLDDVAEKLLNAERAKESTLDVKLVSSSARTGASSGALLYDFDYELDSTRGRKRFITTVTILNSRLYIFNGTYKCDKDGCTDQDQRAVQLLRDIAATFDVG